MVLEWLIPLADAIGAAGFLVASYLGFRNMRGAHVAGSFWLAFTLTAVLGSLWLTLVAVEWLAVAPTLLDALSASIQAVVIGVFAVGTIGTRTIVDELLQATTTATRQREQAERAREELEARTHELERIRDLMRNAERLADVGSWELNTETDVITWTDGTRDIFEVDAGFASDADLALRFYTDEDREQVVRLLERCEETGQSFHTRSRIRTQAGHERWVETYGERTVDEDGTTHIRGCVQDISELHERQEQLAILDRVLRHNLRNDLNTIIGHCELIQDRVEDEITEFVDGIIENANDLVEMANKQRKVTDLIAGPHTRQELAIDRLVERAIAGPAQSHPRATITVESLPTGHLMTIPELRVALEELVHNAIIHNDERSPAVTISGRHVGDRLTITIADNGPGIPSHERRVLADEIEIDPLEHASGVGLWMARRIIRRAGGTIDIEDNEPRGSIVHVSLSMDATG